jgi:hypothetical protein
MRPASVVVPAQRTALITRAVGAAWPLQALVTALWLLAPHGDGVREGWVIALTLAVAPVHLPLLLPRPAVLTRAGINIAGTIAIVQMCALVWAGGGLTSGFELFTLWFLPMTVCALPWRDVAAHIALIVAGCTAGALLATSGGGSEAAPTRWGFAVVAVASATPPWSASSTAGCARRPRTTSAAAPRTR